MAATQINRLATSRAESNSDINESVRVARKKRVRTGIKPNQKQKGKIRQSIMGFSAIARFARIQEFMS